MDVNITLIPASLFGSIIVWNIISKRSYIKQVNCYLNVAKEKVDKLP